VHYTLEGFRVLEDQYLLREECTVLLSYTKHQSKGETSRKSVALRNHTAGKGSMEEQDGAQGEHVADKMAPALIAAHPKGTSLVVAIGAVLRIFDFE
jgi:hypothetical protein